MCFLFCIVLAYSYLCTTITPIYIMAQQFEIIAKTFMGLEPVLAKELAQLGANDVQVGRRMVSFKGDKELLYRANFQLHTAIRILKPIKHFRALSADDVYEGVKDIDWSEYIALDKTFSVDSVVFSEEFRHSKFVAYKVKDAIVDQFRERTGKRPNISITNPDIRLHIHIAEDQCTLCLDSSGESLHRRGYRQESVFFQFFSEIKFGSADIPYKIKMLQPAHKHFDRGFLETEIFGYPYFCRNIVASKDKGGLLYVFLLMPIILNIWE